MISESAFAKLNLYLEVTGKRPDGYHDLVSVMQTISLADTLTFRPCDGDSVHLFGDLSGLPTDGRNLVIRAANAFFSAYGKTFGVEITLHKLIPAAAGLGGGSADAAATLRALNRMADCPFSSGELRKIALSVGADVPFLVEGGTALCRGIGECITPAVNRTGGVFAVAIRGEGVSTPSAFAALDLLFHNYDAYLSRKSPVALLEALAQGDSQHAFSLLYNSFEEAVLPLHPDARALKTALLDSGARVALMSGSGPSVFGWFKKESEAQHAAGRLVSQGARVFVCHAV